MSVTLTGTGGAFTRLGRHYGRVLNANAFLAGGDLSGGGLLSLGVGYNNIEAQYQSTRQDLIDTLYTSRNNARRSLDQLKSDMSGLANNTFQQMVNDDAKLPSLDTQTVFTELIRQMVGSGSIGSTLADSRVKYNSTSVSVSAQTGNTGTGVVTASVLLPDGRPSEYCFPETLPAICTGDAQSQTATSGSEPFSVRGEAANQTGVLGWDWATSPNGSGASAALGATDATLNNSTNLLVNSDFETFTVSNTPDNWAILVGAAGTDIFRSSSPYTGNYGLQFTGTGGSPLSSIAQTFNNSGSGTGAQLQPNTVYAWNCWIKQDGSVAAGSIKIDLIDGSNSTTTGFSGNSNSATIAHGSITSSYASFSGFFTTPAVMPSALKLRVSVSVALTSGHSVYIDRLAMCVPTRVYAGGPYVACFSGATPFIRGDRFNVAVSNDLGGKLQTACWRFFNLPAVGLQIPSDNAAGETIADTLAA